MVYDIVNRKRKLASQSGRQMDRERDGRTAELSYNPNKPFPTPLSFALSPTRLMRLHTPDQLNPVDVRSL